MGRLGVARSNCLRRIVGMKLTDRHRLEAIHEQCGRSSLELIVCRRTLPPGGRGTYCEWIRITCRGRCPRGRTAVKTGSQKFKDFSGMYSPKSGGAMKKVTVEAPLFGTFSSCPATLN
eukprot:286674-Chlamydomonas_euryale.AAC.3